jgi:hypothetical protein
LIPILVPSYSDPQTDFFPRFIRFWVRGLRVMKGTIPSPPIKENYH